MTPLYDLTSQQSALASAFDNSALRARVGDASVAGSSIATVLQQLANAKEPDADRTPDRRRRRS